MATQQTNTAPRFAVGAIVTWPQGQCVIRIDGHSTPSIRWHTRFYNGPILSGANVGGYAMSVPEEQLEQQAEDEERGQ